MKIGIQVGKHFIGYQTNKATLEPFTENVESGMMYRITGSVDDILATLRGDMTDQTLIELFGSIAEIFAPVHAIAGRVVSGSFQFRKTTKSATTITSNADLNNFLTKPNPFQNFYELLYEAVVYELVTGKNYMYFNTPSTMARMDYKNVFATWNLPADRITLKTPDKIKIFSATKVSDVIQAYVLDKGGQDELEFRTDNVMMRRQINLNWKDRKVKGRSPLLSAEKAIANLIAVYQARNVVYVKRGAMGMWVSRKKDDSGMIALSSTEKKALREEVDKDYGLTKGKGGTGKHTVGVTDAPADFVKTSMSLQELMPFEETSADAAAIYGVLEVPYELAPKPKGETYSNQMNAEKGLYQNRAIPIANSWCQSITNSLNLAEAGIEMFVSFKHIEVLQEDIQSQAKRNQYNSATYLAQFTNGVMTLNQWLEKIEGDKSTNPMYDKFIYDMTPQELNIVKEILNIQKPAAAQPTGSNQNPQQDESTTQNNS